MKYLSFLLAFSFVLTASFLLGQDELKAPITFRNSVALAGVDNPFWVAIGQTNTFTKDQLSVVFRRKGFEGGGEPIVLIVGENSDHFFIHPPDVGQVLISVKLNNGEIEIHSFDVELITAVPFFGGNRHLESPTEAPRFCSQRGLYMVIQNLDVNARCRVISYELIHITSGKDAKVVFNKGGNFQPEARKLIGQAQPGDRYIFTKIRYRCPGALADQMGETLSFELE